MAANEEEADVVGEFEYDAVLQGSANFPVITLPVLETESFWQGCLSIEIAHECVYGFIGFLLAVCPKLPEPAVKAWFEFIFHDYRIILLRCFLAESESGKRKPFSFSTSASLAASFS